MTGFAFVVGVVIGLLGGYCLRPGRPRFDPKKLTDDDLWEISKWYRVDMLGAKRRAEQECRLHV